MSVPDQLHISYRGDSLSKSAWQPIGNAYGQFLLKPSGGLWTSPAGADIESSPFIASIRLKGRVEHWLGLQHTRFLLCPLPAVALYTLDTYSDLLRLVDAGKRTLFNIRHDEQMPNSSLLIANVMARKPSLIDWPNALRGYDGICARGYLPPHWECESICWSRWAFASVWNVTPLTGTPNEC